MANDKVTTVESYYNSLSESQQRAKKSSWESFKDWVKTLFSDVISAAIWDAIKTLFNTL
jgi:hypothetical protein